MTEIRSQTVQVGASADELRMHLLDLKNLEPLLPQDKVKGFAGTS